MSSRDVGRHRARESSGGASGAGILDRSREPEPLTPRRYRFPRPARIVMPGGLRVLVSHRPQLPLVSVLIGRESGGSSDPRGEEGLAWMTAQLLTEGAGKRSAAELAEEVEQMGARLDSTTGWDMSTVRMAVLEDKLDEALALASDVMLRPRFDPAEVDREVRQRLAEIQSDRDNPRSIATERYIRFVFDGHRYGSLLAGGESAVGRFTAERLGGNHRDHLHAGDSFLILVGDVSIERGQDLVRRHFAEWPAGSDLAPPIPEPAALPPTRICLVDKPGAVQSEIRVAQPGVARATPDFFPLIMLNAILGEAFGSRLFFNLREEHGYTYGVNSHFSMRNGRGPFVASAAVATEVTAPAVVEFMREMHNIRDKAPTERELQDARGYLSGGLAVDLQSNGSVAERISEVELNKLPEDYMDTYRDRILQVTSEDVIRVANKYLDPEHMCITVVGDARAVADPLRALYPTSIYDVLGNPL